jgi:hypothetical protein
MLSQIATLIGLTILSALYVDGKVPYFPIEVSRLLASGWAAWSTFVFGLAYIGIKLFIFGPWKLLPTWFCIVGIAVFDDVSNWALHMTFVGLMAGTIVIRSIMSPQRLFVILCAAFVYASRLVLKLGAMVVLEGEWTTAYGLEIMYTGQTKSPHTLLIFRVCGVLQWVSFWMLASIA